MTKCTSTFSPGNFRRLDNVSLKDAYQKAAGQQLCCAGGIEEVKVLIKNFAIFFLFPNKEFLPISFKKFVYLLCHKSPGTGEKSRWDQANRRQKPGLVWRNRKKIS